MNARHEPMTVLLTPSPGTSLEMFLCMVIETLAPAFIHQFAFGWLPSLGDCEDAATNRGI